MELRRVTEYQICLLEKIILNEELYIPIETIGGFFTYLSPRFNDRDTLFSFIRQGGNCFYNHLWLSLKRDTTRTTTHRTTCTDLAALFQDHHIKEFYKWVWIYEEDGNYAPYKRSKRWYSDFAECHSSGQDATPWLSAERSGHMLLLFESSCICSLEKEHYGQCNCMKIRDYTLERMCSCLLCQIVHFTEYYSDEEQSYMEKTVRKWRRRKQREILKMYV